MNGGYHAQIVDTIRLQSLERERLTMARIIADDIELEYHSLSLVKIYKGDYVYAADMDGRFEHEAVSVAADGDGRHTFVYSSKKANETVCFISEELNSWRYDFYQALMKIAKEYKGKNGFDERWAFDEAACLSKEGLVEAMVWNSPKEYAGIVTM